MISKADDINWRFFGDEIVLDKNEIGLILDFLSDQYISYENVPLIKLVREMREWYDKQ